MEPENGKDHSEQIPDWLRNLQENSWELELLISGGAVFTLIQLPDYFWTWLTAVRIQTSLPGFTIYLILGIFGIKILTNGFIMHLILRAYWLSLVCLNFVFPGGIKKAGARMQPPFKNPHSEGDLRETIMKVDRICGLVIYSSISSTIILSAIVFASGILILSVDWAENLQQEILSGFLGFVAVSLLISGLFYIADLLLLGALRKLKFLSYLFFPFFRILDFLTFRSLYSRPLVYFGSNVKKSSFFVGAVIFTMLTSFMVYGAVFRFLGRENPFDYRAYKYSMTRNKAALSSRFYADESDWEERQIVYIPSKIIHDDVLSVNVTYVNGMDRLIEASAKIDSLRFVENILEISIDDSVYRDIRWFSRWEKDMSNCGVSAFVPISNLKNGAHVLKIKNSELPDAAYQEILKSSGRSFQIPFWKDVR